MWRVVTGSGVAASDDAHAGRRVANEAVDMPLPARRWVRRTWRLRKKRRQRGMRFGLATDTLGRDGTIAVALAIDWWMRASGYGEGC